MFAFARFLPQMRIRKMKERQIKEEEERRKEREDKMREVRWGRPCKNICTRHQMHYTKPLPRATSL